MLSAPAALVIVPAEEVEERLAAAQRELADLECEVVQARAEADALEAAVAGTFDPDTYTWVSVRLRRFLDDLRAEANAEISTLISTADRSPRDRQPIRLTWAPLVACRDRAEPSAPVVQMTWVPTSTAEPATAPVAAVAVGEPVTAPVVSAVRDAPAEETRAGSDAEIERSLEAEFWAEEQAGVGSRRHWFRAGKAVALQAAAVLLVLTAVLVRLG
jgi:hypothetical protein